MSDVTKVLLVEDDVEVAATVRDALRPAGVALEHVTTLADAEACVDRRVYELLILDLGLPDGDGRDLAAVLRRAGNHVPILMLTAQTEVSQRLDGFASGADDYVCKPFVPEELAARVQAVLRRGRSQDQHVLHYGGASLNLLTREVSYLGRTTSLSGRETSLLAYLMKHPEEQLSRRQLAQEVFGLDPDTDTGVVNVYVNYLRNKLERGEARTRLIHTVRGVGYVLSQTEPQ